jgi:hypothetical protein
MAESKYADRKVARPMLNVPECRGEIGGTISQVPGEVVVGNDD